MLITILYALTIVASLVLVHLSNMTKKEAYLSMFFDLSCMLIMYLGDKQHIAYILACIAALLVVFFIILYFEVIKPSGSIESLRTLISQKKKNPWGESLTSTCVIITIVFSSPTIMLILWAVYLVINRILFYRKFHTLV